MSDEKFCDDESVAVGTIFTPAADQAGKFGLALKSKVVTNILWLTKEQWEGLKQNIDALIERELGNNEYFCDPSYDHSSYADFRHCSDSSKDDLK